MRHLAQVGHQSLEDVGRREVAVVVHVDVDHALGVGADPGQHLDHHPLVLERRAGRLQQVQEDALEEHLVGGRGLLDRNVGNIG